MRRALVLGLLVAACGSRRASDEGSAAPGSATVPGPAADAATAADVDPVADATQLVVVTSADWDATAATLRRYERTDARAPWAAVGPPIDAVLGRAGAAWGRGLHGAGAPGARPGPVKREGDGRSPAGVFRVLRAFGYADAAPPGAALPYAALTPSWRCVDDPASSRYNAVLDAAGIAEDWASAEQMRRADDQYRWVVELDHNHASAAAPPRAVPGDGSCIFLHVWAGPGAPTAGCTAMAPADLEAVLAWLRPGAVVVLLPEAELAALAGPWHLPTAGQ